MRVLEALSAQNVPLPLGAFINACYQNQFAKRQACCSNGSEDDGRS